LLRARHRLRRAPRLFDRGWHRRSYRHRVRTDEHLQLRRHGLSARRGTARKLAREQDKQVQHEGNAERGEQGPLAEVEDHDRRQG